MSVQTDTQTITVNGDKRDVPAGFALTELMRRLDLDPEQATGTAIAVNREVIPREEWTDVTLDDGDDVEIIRAQQGG